MLLAQFGDKMGLSLSEPITTKTTSAVQNEQYKIGVSCMQGWRIDMEDDHTIEIDYIDDSKSCFLAVFDGHGGTNVAKYSAANLYKIFPKLDPYVIGDYHAALKRSFLDTDVKMQEDEAMHQDSSGATAVVVYIKDNKVYCANAGDSRAILSEGGEVFELSHDHKPNNGPEHQRINKAGGYVEFNRVNGNLALSRALGDFTYKQNNSLIPEEQIVTADPEIIEKEMSENDEFIVLACDGIWDCMTNEEVLEYVRDRLAEGKQPHIICEEIMDHCLAGEVKPGGVGCDNMSVIVACLLNGKSFEEFCAKINKSCGSNHKIEKELSIPMDQANNEPVGNNTPNTPLEVNCEKLEIINNKIQPPTLVEDLDEEITTPIEHITLGKEAEIASMLNGNLYN